MLKSGRPGESAGAFLYPARASVSPVSHGVTPHRKRSMAVALQITEPVLALGTESAFEVFARARRLEACGRTVIHLELGEPDAPTPPHILAAGVRALRNGATRYAPPAGLPELRSAIADSLRDRGVIASPDHVIVTSGAKPMLFYALLALVSPGDAVLVPDPGFPIYRSVATFAGGRPLGYPVDAKWPGGINPEAIARLITHNTRVLVLNSPHNPTGTAIDAATLAELAELVCRHDLTVISDEIYHRLLFEGEHRSIAAFHGLAERTVIVDGFSKAYAMTGWRLGYGVMPVELARRIERFVINTTTCAPPFVQHAGIAALEGPQDCVMTLLDQLEAHRDLLVAGLNRLGFACPVPRGAFYAFPSVAPLLRELGLPADLFAAALLDELGLACLPGTGFGPGGADHLRLSFVASTLDLERALERLKTASEPVARAGSLS
jgi:aspartate aminotransferase